MKKIFTLFFVFTGIFNGYSQNNPPTAVNDTANAPRGHAIVDVLNNDFDIDGDQIRILLIAEYPKHGMISKKSDSTLEYTSFLTYTGGWDSVKYLLRDNSALMLLDTGVLYIKVANSLLFDSLDINNINAGFHATGNLFWDLTGSAKFEVPKGSGKNTLFCAALWVAGLDNDDTLHCAADKYRQNGKDYWPGPISNIYDSSYDYKWNRIWKIRKTDIDYHLAHCWQVGYTPIQDLIDWPGNGDVSLGQTAITAPFKDWNNDGLYNPYNGDYPLIKGDAAVYFILNEDRLIHSQSGGHKLGIEVHAMAYAFDCPADSALWNTIFLNYKIFNRSTNIYHDCYAGSYIDVDIGDATDDYMGCDVKRGAFYGYNGDDDDGTGKPGDYGSFPPAQAIVFLAGAKLPDDGIDNPSGLCDEGVNGFGFGNGIADDERLGLSKFAGHTYGGNGTVSVPQDIMSYNLLRAYWNDTLPIQYGGNGDPDAGSYGPACSYMFPGNSDPCNWGTGGVPPNGPAYWSEVTAGNVPDDRRGVGSTGPFTFNPGDIQQLDLAFVFGRDYINPSAWDGAIVMQERIDSIIQYFRNDSTPCGGSFSVLGPQPEKTFSVNLFPNPATDYITIAFAAETGSFEYVIYNIVGEKIIAGKINKSGNNVINISALKPGLYFVNASDGNNTFSKKFVKK